MLMNPEFISGDSSRSLPILDLISSAANCTSSSVVMRPKVMRRNECASSSHLLFFSSLDQDGHFAENIIDESVDVEKIVETQMMIESLRYAISKLNDEERDIIERLYFNDETVRSVAKLKSITHPALIKRRNKILEKLKKFIEEI